jgi:hypothetical protein
MILTTDIEFLLSAPMAASGYTMPGVPGNCLGKFASTTQLSATFLNNIFQDLTGAQNAAGQVDYACLFIYNGNASDTMLNPVVWLPTALLGSGNTATFAVGADPTTPSILGSGTAQAVVIQNPLQAPAGVTSWYSPSATQSGGVALPDIPAQDVAAVWLQRTATGLPSLNQLDIDVTFDTLP